VVSGGVAKLHDGIRLDVRKTYKLFLNGEFVRSESGRADVHGAGSDDSANVARASRKDFRDAVVGARAAFEKWSNAAPSNRGLVLYRLAEMMEARRAQFVERLRAGMKLSNSDAERETVAAIDRTLWYAGWCDKYVALLSSRNPVAGPFFNYSSADPMGVIAAIAPDAPALLGLVSTVLPPLVAGNAVVALASEVDPRTAIVFAECVATCDLPDGALSILTGHRSEIAGHMARHMDVNAFAAHGLEPEMATEMEQLSADNLKRVRIFKKRADWFADEAQSLDDVAAFVETKTIWHPARI
jgi:acyl-CoA reductase-like NAD-dependent aldehyde dehydrogenase